MINIGDKMNDIICPECGVKNIKDLTICKECETDLRLNNRYYLLKILGENYGTTYLAKDIDNDTEVIVKELSLRTLDRWKTEELFTREISVLSKLNHHAIPKFIESFSLGKGKNSRIYLVMEKINGKTLEEYSRSRYYKIEDILRIMREVLTILEYLHSMSPPIIHRDLKPSNIVIDEQNNIYLIDFGSVRDIIKPKGGSTIIGTFGYMPPEQFSGKVSKKSDYYALGVIAVVMLSRKLPEELYDGYDFNWREYVDLSPNVNFLLKGLLNNEKDRFSTTKEIIEIIDDIISNKDKILSARIKRDKEEIETLNKKESKPTLRENLLIPLAEKSRWNKIIKYIEIGKNIDELGKFNENLLHYAIDENNKEIVKFLIKNYINIDNQNRFGQTAIMFALRERKYDIVNLLLENKVDIYKKNDKGCSILMIVAQNDSLEVFMKILNKQDINLVKKERDSKGESLLFYAYRNRDKTIFRYLIENEVCNINNKDSMGETILIKISRIGGLDLVKLILTKKPLLEIKDNESETALFNAIKHKNYDIFKYLLENRADINTQNEIGWTPLMKAVTYKNILIIKYILKNRASKSIKNNNGDTALKIANYIGDKEIINILKK